MTFRDIVCDLINKNGYKHIAEIGVWAGTLSEMIIKKCSPETLILVDPLKQSFNNFDGYTCTMGGVEKTQFELDRMAEKIESLPATFYRMTSVEASKLVPDKSLDFVFIDAIHLEEYVKEDILTWLPKIKKGGMIAGDDYKGGKHARHVSKAVTELLPNHQNIEKIWFYKLHD